MMTTVLNLGSTDRTWFARPHRRRRALRLGLLPPLIEMYSSVVLGIEHHEFEDVLDHFKEAKDYSFDTQLTAEDWRRVVAHSRTSSRRMATPSAGPARAAVGRGEAVFSSWMNHRAIVYRTCTTFPKAGHRRQCAGDGVRQYGREFRHRRRLHPNPRPATRRCTAINPAQCAGEDSSPHPHAASR